MCLSTYIYNLIYKKLTHEYTVSPLRTFSVKTQPKIPRFYHS